MPGKIKFATVSDARSIQDIFSDIPENVPLQCLDTWTIKTKFGSVFNGGLIFFRESDFPLVQSTFDRVRLCKVWNSQEKSDKKCIFIRWDSSASEEDHLNMVSIVNSIIKEFAVSVLNNIQPDTNSRRSTTFICFKEKGRSFVPLLIGALNSHPLLRTCKITFANKRIKLNNVEYESTATQKLMLGTFTSTPKILKTKKLEETTTSQ